MSTCSKIKLLVIYFGRQHESDFIYVNFSQINDKNLYPGINGCWIARLTFTHRST